MEKSKGISWKDVKAELLQDKEVKKEFENYSNFYLRDGKIVKILTCINNDDWEDMLTLNKEYEIRWTLVRDTGVEWLGVIDDLGQIHSFTSDRFKGVTI